MNHTWRACYISGFLWDFIKYYYLYHILLHILCIMLICLVFKIWQTIIFCFIWKAMYRLIVVKYNHYIGLNIKFIFMGLPFLFRSISIILKIACKHAVFRVRAFWLHFFCRCWIFLENVTAQALPCILFQTFTFLSCLVSMEIKNWFFFIISLIRSDDFRPRQADGVPFPSLFISSLNQTYSTLVFISSNY